MILKLIGGFIAVIIAYFIGDGTLDTLRHRIAFYTELEAFASRAEKQISQYKLSLPEIIESTQSDILASVGFYGYLTTHTPIEADYITDGEREAVARFASAFTRSGEDEEKATHELAELARDVTAKTKNEYEKKKKVARSLPPLAVTALLILIF